MRISWPAIALGLVVAASPGAKAEEAGGSPAGQGRAEVSFGRPTILGSLPRELVLRVARRGLPGLEACYERSLSRSPRLGGRVVVRFVVPPEGALRAVAVEHAAVPGRALPACIVRAVRRWVFPAGPPGLSVVTLAIVLRPTGDQGSSTTPWGGGSSPSAAPSPSLRQGRGATTSSSGSTVDRGPRSASGGGGSRRPGSTGPRRERDLADVRLD